MLKKQTIFRMIIYKKKINRNLKITKNNHNNKMLNKSIIIKKSHYLNIINHNK